MKPKKQNRPINPYQRYAKVGIDDIDDAFALSKILHFRPRELIPEEWMRRTNLPASFREALSIKNVEIRGITHYG